MAKPDSVRNGFPCVICGGRRSHASKGNAFKICHVCFKQIRYGVKDNPKVYQRNCEVCGVEMDRLSSIPACNFCRSKWYRERKLKKLLNEAIDTNRFSHLTIKIKDVLALGYELIIKKKDN